MSARFWALGFVCSFIGVTAGATTACSSKANQVANNKYDDDSEEPETDAGSSKAPKGSSSDDDTTQSVDAGSSKPSVPVCTPTDDDPDDNFADTNCDGIDGDKSKAVFVAATGSDAADGTWGKPVATLGKGIALATSNNKDVYVCGGDYVENIAIDAIGVKVYGGYDCEKAWARNPNSQAHLIAPSGSALVITNTDKTVVFDHVDITSSDVKAGFSSVAVFVSKSTQVTLRRGAYTAGSGGNAVTPEASPEATNSLNSCFAYVYPGGCYGEPGTYVDHTMNCLLNNQIGSAYYMTAAKVSDPSIQLAPFSDDAQSNFCKNGVASHGGKGGGTNTSSLQQGSNGMPGVPASTTGALNGADGKSGSSGAAATQAFGTLSETGYVTSNSGTPGGAGSTGEAGTGGNGGGMGIIFNGGAGDFPYYLYAPRAGGGKGGFGGCPGDGGAAGNAGGASIAVASYQSKVSLDRVTLTTAKGGNGSAGALGGDGAGGQPGGVGGTAKYECSKCPAEEATACASVAMTDTTSAQAGGKGGKGGSGGQGGPGGGGPSIPLFVTGTAPTLSAVTFLPGSGGLGGSNGGSRAADGESVDQKVLP